MMDSVLDTVLDRSVIGGYANIGYRIRRRGWSASERSSLGEQLWAQCAELSDWAQHTTASDKEKQDGPVSSNN